MLTVAKIHPTNFSFDEVSYEDIDHNLSKLLKPFIDIVPIQATTQEETLQEILKHLDLPENSNCVSYMCNESDDKLTYLMYCVDNTNPKNLIGRFLSEKHEEVFGNCIVLQTINGTQNCNITLKEVTDIIRKRFIHKSVIIYPNRTIEERSFTNSPIDGVDFTEDNCRCIQIEFLEKALCLFVQRQPTIDCINEYATIIGKKTKIHGKVIITLLTQSPSVEIMDLTEELMHKILCAISDNSISRNRTNDDKSENFFVNLERRYMKHNNINLSIPPDIREGPCMNTTFV